MSRRDVLIFPFVGLFGFLTFFTLVYFFSSSISAQAVTGGQTLNVAVAKTITITVASSTYSLAQLTPGTPVTATTSVSVTTNSANGFDLSIKRDDTDTTIDLTTDATVNFPDATAWNSTGSGNATSSASIGANLSFRVHSTSTSPTALYNSTFWGTNDIDPNAKYAGLPSTSDKIASNTTYSASAQTVVYGFRADAPTTQKSGSYDGTITLTALVAP